MSTIGDRPLPLMVIDNGSLAAKLYDQPGLVRSMLAIDVLDPHEISEQVANLDPSVALEQVRLAISEVADLRRAINALEAREAVAMERARHLSLRAEGWILDEEFLHQANPTRKTELVHRTLVAELAIGTHLSERQISTRMYAGQSLCARAPKTLKSALNGEVQWINAFKVADAVCELPLTTAFDLDESVVYAATTLPPQRFNTHVRRARERVHPTPIAVRHQEAACKRSVSMQPADDGMAYLQLFATAPVIHAVWDRVNRTAVAAKSPDDGRTLAQLRADTMAALLLDDGTLDQQATLFEAIGFKARGPENATETELDSESSPKKYSWMHFAEPLVGESNDSPAFSLAKHARGIRPQIFVTVPMLTLLGLSDEPALLDGMVPVDPGTAQELTSLAPSLTRLLTDPLRGEVLAIDSKKYRPPADLGEFTKLRDVTCRFPGCNRRASEADVDHNRQASRGGSTSSSNLARLCRSHHIIKEQARFEVTQDSSGVLNWRTPFSQRVSTFPGKVPVTLHAEVPHGIGEPDDRNSDYLLDHYPDEPPF